MKVVNKLLGYFNLRLNRISSLEEDERENQKSKERIVNFFHESLLINVFELNNEISGIVFSKDRAMQLHALLSSYFYYVKNFAPLKILFICSSEEHEQSYQILKSSFKNFPVDFIKETQFDIQLRKMISNIKADRLFFMTDDGIFLDSFDLHDCLLFDPRQNIFSLRLGVDFDFCYTHDRKQDVPLFEKNAETQMFKYWVWKHMKDSPDWSYPLSVDATIFCKKEIEIMLNGVSFKNPNSLESQMQRYNDLFTFRNGVCYAKTKYVNVPCNIVQNEFDNNFTGAFSVDELLQHFLDGERIDWKKLEKYKARDAQTVKFSFLSNE